MYDIIVKTKPLGEVSRDIGQVLFASVFIGGLMDGGGIVGALVGLVFTFVFWSVYIFTKNDNQ
jgi:hypothetical protein